MSAPACVPRSMAQRKPAHGQPCNGCGLCCYVVPCELGRALFATDTGPCPALGFDEQGQSCCLVAADPRRFTDREAPAHVMRNAALYLIRAGDGCDARINGEPTDAGFNARVDARDDSRARAQARFLWRVPAPRNGNEGKN
jgi:hypothetical protein